jgi:uncharacterized protein
MQPSRFNILTRIEDSEGYILVNLLSGQADLITANEAMSLSSPGGSFADLCIQKGYLVDPEEEELRYNLKYVDFLETRNNEEVQVFFVPTYHCNFNCSYCYQSSYSPSPGDLSEGLLEGVFRFVDTQLNGRRHYMTLFGGEPLLPGKAHQQAIRRFIELCGQHHTELAIVTNGYHLDTYFEFFQAATIREVQLTLDGTRDVHNARRPLTGGNPSFDVISRNLDRCLELGYPVNLRVVLDRQNIENLPELARYASERGWTDHPLFKTQLGRNYELHQCQPGNQSLYSRIELYKDLYRILKKHPELADFHQPAFSITRFLFSNQHLPDPLYDACPACKSEWALDFTGKVYSCTATVGKEGEELGTFYPELLLNQEAIKLWQNRDVVAIKDCHGCDVQLACGGGCGSLAKNLHGNLLTPDCRPVKELIRLGSAIYFS